MGGAPDISSIFAQRLVVGVGDMAVSSCANVVVSTYALGSCIGIAAYEPKLKVGGILHIMLPSSQLAHEKAKTQPFIFADTGIKMFLHELRCIGAFKENLKMVIAGGAAVLTKSDMFKIGERNIEAVQLLFLKESIVPVHKELGGYNNRTLHLTLSTGELEIKMPNEKKVISLQ